MRRVLVTGSEGYLMRQLVARLSDNSEVEKIVGVDIVEPRQSVSKFSYHRLSVTEYRSLKNLVKEEKIDTVVHAAWTFNPVHDRNKQDEVDIGGTQNVLLASLEAGVKNIVYLGSTTGYGAIPENTRALKEEDWANHASKRKSVPYAYAANKAVVDHMVQNFAKDHPEINVFWIRGSIVMGPNTKNIVSYVANSPFTLGMFMFQVKGYNPPMQFVSEDDMISVLYKATMEKWTGVVNVAGEGVIDYERLIKLIGKKKIVLPAWFLYPMCDVLWKIRYLKFPSSLVDLIRYPWVGDISKLKETYKYTPKHTSEDAVQQFKRSS